MKRRSQPVVKSVQHTGGRPGGNTIVFLFGQNGRILDDGRNDSVSAVSNCTMESLSTLVVLPVDHCLRLRPERRGATDNILGHQSKEATKTLV